MEPGLEGGIRRRLDGLGDGPHEARADDHAVRPGVRGGGRLGPVGDAEPERDGDLAARFDARQQAPRIGRLPEARSPVVPVTETV